MSILFSATYPQRTSALILYGSMARFAWSPDNPWGRTEEEVQRRARAIEQDWGQESTSNGTPKILLEPTNKRGGLPGSRGQPLVQERRWLSYK